MFHAALAQLSFVHPGIAFAALAVAPIPLVIHLLSRRRYRRVPWAAMDFLLAASRRSRRRGRIEQFLLIAARTAAIVCIVLAIARPYVSSDGRPLLGSSPVHRVIILDNSLSMQADDGQGVRFEAARNAAVAMLDGFSKRDEVSFITAAAPAKVVCSSSFDRRRVRTEIAQVRASESSTDVSGAINLCRGLLADDDAAPGNAAVYIVSDLAGPAWGAGGTAALPPAVAAGLKKLSDEAALTIRRVGTKDAGNVRLADLAPVGAFGRLGPDTPLRLSAELVNDGAHAIADASLEIISDGEVMRRVTVPALAPHESRRVSFSVAAGPRAWLNLEARLATDGDDAIKADNRRYVALQLPESVPVLVVDDRVHAAGSFAGSQYLMNAMAPRSSAAHTLLAPKCIPSATLGHEPLDDQRLLVLCNIAKLDPAMWDRLARYVQEGGGLLVIAGDRTDVASFNSCGYRDGQGVLPAELGDIRDAAGPEIADFRIAVPRSPNPLVAALADMPGSSLFHTLVHRYVQAEPDDSAQVVLSLENGAPLLVVGEHGQGLVALLTIPVDMSWSNLPAKGDFVSLVQTLAGHLADAGDRTRNVLVGQSFARRLTAEEISQPVVVVGPAGQAVAARRAATADGFTLIADDLPGAGLYRLGPAGNERWFSVNVDPAESDLRSIDEQALRTSLGDRFAYAAATATTPVHARARASEFALALVWGGIALVMLETWMAMRFSAGR